MYKIKGELTMIMKTIDLTLIPIFAALTAIGAFIKIPIPIVPCTLQYYTNTNSAFYTSIFLLCLRSNFTWC